MGRLCPVAKRGPVGQPVVACWRAVMTLGGVALEERHDQVVGNRTLSVQLYRAPPQRICPHRLLRWTLLCCVKCWLGLEEPVELRAT